MFPIQIQVTLDEDQANYIMEMLDGGSDKVIIGPNENDYIIIIDDIHTLYGVVNTLANFESGKL